MSEVVLIVGASTRAIAESAIGAGYACTTVDYFGDIDQMALVPNLALGADLGEPCTSAALVRVARSISANSVAYAGGLENYPQAVSRLASGRELLGNRPSTLRRVRNPHELADVLRAAGVTVPHGLEASAQSSDVVQRYWLRKRLRSGGGLCVRRWRPGEEVAPDEVVQEYVEGTPASAVGVADGRRAVVLGLSRQLIGVEAFGASDFRYCGSILPLTEDEDELEAVLEQVQRAAQAVTAAFGLRGVFGIDFVSEAGSVCVLEVNPRFTASMELVERAYGMSIFDLHVRSCRGRLPSFEPLRQRRRAIAYGKAILFARRPLALADTRPWLAQGIRDVPRPGSRIAPGSPICTLFATAAMPVACEQALRRRARAHESSRVSPYEQGRGDEGASPPQASLTRGT